MRHCGSRRGDSPTRRLLLALALGTAVALVLATSARPVANLFPLVFTDDVGDSGTAADVASVAVTNDEHGTFTFDLVFATPLVHSSVADIYFDSDLNGSTGDPRSIGADFLVKYVKAASAFEFDKWDGTQWNLVNNTVEMSGTPDGRALVVHVGRSDLAGSKAFNFSVVSTEGDGSPGHIDVAPSSGSWQYAFRSLLRLSGATSHAVKAGGKWLVTLTVRRSDSGAPLGPEAAILCSATSGSTTLAVIEHAFISARSGQGSTAVCEFAVPKKLKHKLLHGTIEVSVPGQAVRHSFTQRVS
jgi:hypothetical protein